jgi:hypothetical protein
VVEHPVQQPFCRIVGHQPGSELAQDRGVKPVSASSKPRAYSPVDPAADRIGGLPVRQSLDKLQHRHQRQPRR